MKEKRCPACGLVKPIDQFNWRDSAHTRIQSYCRDCSNGAWNRWYRDPGNKAKHLDQLARRRLRRTQRNVKLVNELKSKPCADCGETFPPHVMDFDHIGVKFTEVSSLVRTHSTERLLAEVSLCEVVCSNCHRERTQRRL